MPEGPSLFKWCTMTKQFLGRKITRIAGSSKTVDKMKWSGAFLEDVRVYGKKLFLHLTHTEESTGSNTDEEDIWIRCHFLMWGSVRVNEFNCKPSKTNNFPEPRLVFYFSKEEFLVFYGGSFQELNEPPEDQSQSDILSDRFDRCKAVDHILENYPICFILLDQRKFTGLGNIIKNEVLFSTGTHPMQVGSQLSRAKAANIVETVVTFTKRWLSWKMEEKPSRKFGDWAEIYKKSICPNGHKTTKSMFGPTGMERITYWCTKCQPMKGNDQPLENRASTHEPEKSQGTDSEPSLAGISEDILDSKDLLTRPDENRKTEVDEVDQKVPLSMLRNISGKCFTNDVQDFQQEEFPTSSNKEFMEKVSVMQEIHSSVDDSPCVLKSEQTKLLSSQHRKEMNGNSLTTVSLETELNSSKTIHNKLDKNEKQSPLSMKEPRQHFHVAKKIKLESEGSSTFDGLSEDRPYEPVSHISHFTKSPPDCVQDQQCGEEDSIRISVSMSTINVLMRSRVRVKKLKL